MTARKPTPAEVLSVPVPAVLRLEPGATLSVQLLPPPKEPAKPRPWPRTIIGVLALLVLGYFILAGLYLLPKTHVAPTPIAGLPDLALSLTHPAYLAFGDVATVDVTIINRGNTAVTGTVVLAFTGAMPVRTAPARSTAIGLANLSPGASLSEQVNVSLGRAAWLHSESVPFRVLVEADGQRGDLPGSQALHTAPIPYLGTVWTWLPSGSVLLASLLAFVWEQIKPRLAARQER